MGKDDGCLGCEATKKQNIDTETNLNLNLIRDVTSPKSESTSKKSFNNPILVTQGKEVESSIVKQRELRQLELKLKKREENLKVRESSVNEKLKDKTKLIDYIHKIEARNMELEQTIKTMNRKILILEEKQQNMLPNISNSEPQNLTNCKDESDDLLLQVRSKVTKFIVNKIENELDKLSCNLSDTDKKLSDHNIENKGKQSVAQEWSYPGFYHSQYPYQTTFESYEGRNDQYNDPHYNSVNEKYMCYEQSEQPVQNIRQSNLIDVHQINSYQKHVATNQNSRSDLHSNKVHKGQNYPSQYAGQNLYYQNQNSENSTQDCYFLDLKSLTPKQPI